MSAPGCDRVCALRTRAIVHLVAPAPFGGLESVVRGLAAAQARRGHRVHVLAVVEPEVREHPFVAGLVDAGIPATAIRVPGRGYLRERVEVTRLCRALGAEVLHTHGYRPDVVDAGVARALGIPRVTTVHGFTGGGWRNRLYERLQRTAYLRFDAVVAVSRRLAGELVACGIGAERVHTVPNAWTGAADALEREPARRELRIAPDRFALGWVGRLSREKGLDVLLQALPALTDLPLQLHVLGDGRERAALTARAAALGIADRLAWHGHVPHAGRYFAAFDAFVLSSRTEGTPIALFEGMAAGVPVIAARVGGVPDVVGEAEALLVPPEDPAALTAAIRRLLQAPGEAVARAGAARARLAAEYAVPAWLDRYDSVYESALITFEGGL